jgi:hypothetical protein
LIRQIVRPSLRKTIHHSRITIYAA